MSEELNKMQHPNVIWNQTFGHAHHQSVWWNTLIQYAKYAIGSLLTWAAFVKRAVDDILIIIKIDEYWWFDYININNKYYDTLPLNRVAFHMASDRPFSEDIDPK